MILLLLLMAVRWFGVFERIAKDAKFHLKQNGIILLEIGFGSRLTLLKNL